MKVMLIPDLHILQGRHKAYVTGTSKRFFPPSPSLTEKISEEHIFDNLVNGEAVHAALPAPPSVLL
jgi:hypothetical protein